jgi:hypothetical protein
MTDETKILYFSYGSNLSRAQMRERCPGARRVGPLVIPDGALAFRLHADIELREGSSIPGGVWEITRAHERVLDSKEGVKTGLYVKRHIRLSVGGQQRTCLYYRMRRQDGLLRPTETYRRIIADGYREFGLDLDVLERAISEAADDRSKLPDWLRRRYYKKGQPALALPIGAYVIDYADPRWVGVLEAVNGLMASVAWNYGAAEQIPLRRLQQAPGARIAEFKQGVTLQ